MYDNDTLEFDIDAIMEGTESTLAMIFDEESAFDEEVNNTVISDDIDDMAIENIIGLGDLITDDDIDAIDKGRPPVDANDPIDDDAETGENDPEIFRLQRDVFQNSLLTDNDIKDLREGMSLEEFTGKVLQEGEIGMPDANNPPAPDAAQPVAAASTAEGEGCEDKTCGECHHNPCICDKPITPNTEPEPKIDYDLTASFEKFADKLGDDDDDDDFEDDFDDDDDHHDFNLDDEVNAPANVPAGPVQALNDGKECGDNATSNLPFAPTASESEGEEESPYSLSKLENEEGENTMFDKTDFTEEEMEMLEAAYAEGYNTRVEEEGSEESPFTEEQEEMIAEAYAEGYDSALEAVEEALDEEGDLDASLDDLVDGIHEGLEDIDIENDFEGSGINDEQKDANKGMFVGWDKNTDEPGGTSQNDTTLPFENVTVKSFDGIEDDSKECMLK